MNRRNEEKSNELIVNPPYQTKPHPLLYKVVRRTFHLPFQIIFWSKQGWSDPYRRRTLSRSIAQQMLSIQITLKQDIRRERVRERERQCHWFEWNSYLIRGLHFMFVIVWSVVATQIGARIIKVRGATAFRIWWTRILRILVTWNGHKSTENWINSVIY